MAPEALLVAHVVTTPGTEPEAEPVTVELAGGSITFVEDDGRRVTFDETELRTVLEAT